MAYSVELTLRAERDLEYLYQRISAAESAAAARWFNGLERAIQRLERFPRRCATAPESKKAGRPLRQLLYGAKRDVYRRRSTYLCTADNSPSSALAFLRSAVSKPSVNQP
jgi:plasmid stabilization system protein ParE